MFLRQHQVKDYMRRQLIKLKTGHSTKAERRFSELLKRFHIPFRTKVFINKKEIDFVIGKYAIEIDGHKHSASKNSMLWGENYFPIHIYNHEVNKKHIVDWLKIICQEQD